MGKRAGNTIGFLERLRKDVRGNAIMLVAAAIFPMLGLIGGGVDMSRIYLAKSRLQQACDAGALAGRKAMGGGSWTQNNSAPNTAALAMFDANFVDGAYGSTARTRSFTENAGTITGTTSVILPMAIMKIFGISNKDIAIICKAEMRIPNSDVMFVLDNTGSMADCPDGTKCNSGPGSKIVGLRAAVKCFYEALAKIDTDEDCGSTPTTANGSQVQLRFGFVPYDVNVKVGRLLQNDWLVDQRTYQSRVPVLSSVPTLYSTANGTKSSWSSYTNYGLPATNVSNTAACDSIASGTSPSAAEIGLPSAPINQKYTGKTAAETDGFPVNTLVDYDVTVQTADYTYQGIYNNGQKTCQVQRRQRTYTQTKTYTFSSTYRYRQVKVDVSGFKAGGSNWNTSTSLPWGVHGALQSSTWDGCIEERQTWVTDSNPANDYTPIPASAFDMDIDMVPTSDDATKWAPIVDDMIWGRYVYGTSTTNASNYVYANLDDPNELSKGVRTYSCPAAAARKLQIYDTAAPFDTYVDSMTPGGNTYHDIGLIWGVRLLSPTGLFASENAMTPLGGEIQRHLIFMTDGDTVTSFRNITPQGTPWWDRRQTNPANAPTDANLTANVNARTQAICTAVKNKNITLWVISFGSGVSNAAQTLLQNCASPGRFYNAANSTQLIDQFRQIADNISQLRLTD